MTHRVHLDYASNAPLREEARVAMRHAIESEPFDPRRLYDDAITARYAIETCREQIADFIGCDPFEVIFTSSHAESLCMFAFGCINTEQNRFANATGLPQPRVICTPYDSQILFETFLRENVNIDMLAGNQSATLDLSNLENLVTENTAACTIPFAHPDTGTLQEYDTVLEIVKEKKPDCLVHLDARLGIGNARMNFASLGVDAMSIDPVTFGGPSGIAALILSRKAHLSPLFIGSTQERARRAGLENYVGIAGFASACVETAKSLDVDLKRNQKIKKSICEALKIAGTKSLDVDPDSHHSLSHMTSAYFEGIAASAVVANFNSMVINIHAGSSCGSEDFEPSPQLAPVTKDDAISESVFRISWGYATTDKDVRRFIDGLNSLEFLRP